MTTLRLSSNWVEGDQFFDREEEIHTLRERVENGTYTLLTAQRRMGKTSLVRELLRRLDEEGQFTTVFVDLESAMNEVDAVAEMASQILPVQSKLSRLRSRLGNYFRGARDHVEEIGAYEIKLKLRAGMNAGNWQRTGDQVFEALATNERPVVLVIDELPILINRLLKGQEYRITPDRRASVDGFMSWMRKNCQDNGGRVRLIVSGSIGLGPILHQAGLSSHANVFDTFELKPWPREIAMECLAALARGHGKYLPEDVRGEMCRRLRCCIPHHVQQFFQHLHEHLDRSGRVEATMADAEQVYEHELLSVRGQIGLVHYEDRLRMVFGPECYTTALALLTEAAVNDGLLTHETAKRYGEVELPVLTDEGITIDNMLYTLEHDGYLEAQGEGYRFVSGLLEDWWRARHGQPFTSINAQ